MKGLKIKKKSNIKKVYQQVLELIFETTPKLNGKESLVEILITTQ
jgi:hypothetical protein